MTIDNIEKEMLGAIAELIKQGSLKYEEIIKDLDEKDLQILNKLL